MRKKVGIGGVLKKRDETKQFSSLGHALEVTKLATVRDVMENFKVALEEFAGKHRARINSDPEFRLQFHKMCIGVGVDPLASSKGFWADFLGVGDFYYDLGVAIIQITLQTRSSNGGIISLAEIMRYMKSSRIKCRQKVTEEDIRRSIEKLAIMGSGFKLINTARGSPMLLSVPLELNRDHEILLSEAQHVGYISDELLQSNYQWTKERFALAIHPLLQEGIVWIDDVNGIRLFHLPPCSSGGGL